MDDGKVLVDLVVLVVLVVSVNEDNLGNGKLYNFFSFLTETAHVHYKSAPDESILIKIYMWSEKHVFFFNLGAHTSQLRGSYGPTRDLLIQRWSYKMAH